MKSIYLAMSIFLAVSAAATETVECKAIKAVQYGEANMEANVDLRFELNRNANDSIIQNIRGHVFVKSPYEEGQVMNEENAYMGYFHMSSLKANSDYNPIKYKDWFQFKDFNAQRTSGLEDGMWGSLVLDLSSDDQFNARYIFQAGDHMGATVLLKCSSN